MEIFDNLSIGVQIIDEQMRYLYLNKSILAQVNRTLEDHIGKKMGDVYPGIEREAFYQKIQECLRESKNTSLKNAFFLDGRETFWELDFERIPEGVLIFSRNITDNDVKESLEIPFNFLSEPCFLISKKTGKIIKCNKSMLEIMRATEDEILGLTQFDISPEFQESVGRTSMEVGVDLISKLEENDYIEFEWTHKRFDGSEFLVKVFVREYMYYGDLCFLSIWRDLSHLKDQEKLHQHHAKMTTIANLAAGVGHEINNPLAIILSNVEILRKKLKKGIIIEANELDLILHKLLPAIDRISNITTALRNFTQDKVEKTERFSPLMAIKEMELLLGEQFREKGIHYEIFSSDGAEKVLINGLRRKFQQVFANLLSNAKFAVSNSSLKKITIHLKLEGKLLRIDVKDSGEGIPVSELNQVFDLFYTTKGPRDSLGFGLSYADKYIREMNGSISVASSPGIGTTFSIQIPFL